MKRKKKFSVKEWVEKYRNADNAIALGKDIAMKMQNEMINKRQKKQFKVMTISKGDA